MKGWENKPRACRRLSGPVGCTFKCRGWGLCWTWVSSLHNHRAIKCTAGTSLFIWCTHMCVYKKNSCSTIKTVILVCTRDVVRMPSGENEIYRNQEVTVEVADFWFWAFAYTGSSNYVCCFIHKIEQRAAVVSSFIISQYPLMETWLSETESPGGCRFWWDETHGQMGSRLHQLPNLVSP